jgi:hypothetical protein
MKAFDPVAQLTAREAVRFVGTVGDVITGALPIYEAIVKSFASKEIRAVDELAAVVVEYTSAIGGKACSVGVARHTVEVAVSLRLLSAIPQVSAANKKFSLGDAGRVVGAMLNLPRYSPAHRALVFRRPLFEAHGDYLLQALVAIQQGDGREAQLARFTANVRDMVEAKLEELPDQRQGISWDIFAQEVRARRDFHKTGVSTPTEMGARPTIEDLRRAKKLKEQAAIRGYRDTGPTGSVEVRESKTFLHQFSRCRSWLSDLELVSRQNELASLTREGERVLRYFQQKSVTSPARIPPSAALLSDAFQMSDSTIEGIWGSIVDDLFWEEGLYDVSKLGVYLPGTVEFLEMVDWAFNQIRIKQVSEASLSALRQSVFLAFLIGDRPVKSAVLDAMLEKTFEDRGDLFGLGRNRQGRPAFVFRRKKAIG